MDEFSYLFSFLEINKNALKSILHNQYLIIHKEFNETDNGISKIWASSISAFDFTLCYYSTNDKHWL